MKCSIGLWLLTLIIVLGIITVTVQILFARVHVSPRLAEELFQNFTKKFNKSYNTPEEYQKRLNIFTVSFLCRFTCCCCCCCAKQTRLVRNFASLNLNLSNRWKILFAKIRKKMQQLNMALQDIPI